MSIYLAHRRRRRCCCRRRYRRHRHRHHKLQCGLITHDISTLLSAQGAAVKCCSALIGCHRHILTTLCQNNGTEFM